MKRLEAMAFDWADENCGCEKNDDVFCVASELMRGYEAGFRKAREMAYELMSKNRDKGIFCLDVDIENLGEDEV